MTLTLRPLRRRRRRRGPQRRRLQGDLTNPARPAQPVAATLIGRRRILVRSRPKPKQPTRAGCGGAKHFQEQELRENLCPGCQTPAHRKPVAAAASQPRLTPFAPTNCGYLRSRRTPPPGPSPPKRPLFFPILTLGVGVRRRSRTIVSTVSTFINAISSVGEARCVSSRRGLRGHRREGIAV